MSTSTIAPANSGPEAPVTESDSEQTPTAATGSKSHSTPPDTTVQSQARVKSSPDEIEFFDFAKQYMGLVAGLAAVPLVTNGLGVIPTPNGFGLKDLSAVASLLCIIVFGAVFSMRHILGRTQEARFYGWRVVPAFLVLTALGTVAWQISLYLPPVSSFDKQSAAVATDSASRTAGTAMQGRTVATDQKGVANVSADTPQLIRQYLCIQVLIVFAIAVVLVTAFTMQEAHQIQNMIERDMQKQRFELLERIKCTDAFYKLARTNKAFEDTGEALVLKARHRELKQLAEGRINAFGESARHLQQFLLKHHLEAFDAVSDRDLDFWTKKDIEPFSQAYDQLLASATERGTRLSRLLLFSDDQLARWKDISKVMRDHEEQGYGWAVAPYRTVERSVLDTEQDLDFALFNGNAAISYFRDYHSSFRHLEVIFNNLAGITTNSETIETQAIRYLKLCAQAWVCNRAFAQRIATILQQKKIGTKKISDAMVHELSKCLKASTLSDTNSIPEQERAKIRTRVREFAPETQVKTDDLDWRSGMMIDSRDLQGTATQLSEENLDVMAWTLLWYRRKAKNWEGPLTCDMLLITNMTAIGEKQSPTPVLRADIRGVACSLEKHDQVQITLHVKDVHEDSVVDLQAHTFDKSRYDVTRDLYELVAHLPGGLASGRYRWELTASDGATQPHCTRKASRGCWFSIPSTNPPSAAVPVCLFSNGVSSVAEQAATAAAS